MNLKTSFTLIVVSLCVIAGFAFRHVDAQSPSVWYPTGTSNKVLVPVNNTWGLRVPGIASSTTGCLRTDSAGNITPSGSDCGTGSGSALTGTSTEVPFFGADGFLTSDEHFTYDASANQTFLPSNDSAPSYTFTGQTGVGISAGSGNRLRIWSNSAIAANIRSSAGVIGILNLQGSGDVTTVQVTGGTSSSGLFFPDLWATAIASVGTERFRVAKTGGVGIGSTSPAAMLAIAGSSTAPALSIWSSAGAAELLKITDLGSTIASTTLTGSTTLQDATSSTFATTLLRINSENFTDLTGTALQVSGGALSCLTASASQQGCLTGTDWSTFNNKISSSSLSVTDSSQIDLGYTSATGVFTASIIADSIGDSQLAFNTGQNLTTASSPTFAGLTLSSQLTVANGGTGATSFTAGNVLYGNGTAAIGSVATGTVSGTNGITVTAARAALGGALAIDCTVSSASAAGCLSTTHWSAFNNKISSTSIDTSIELAALLTDETGSGANVFATNATLASTTLTGSTTLQNATSTTFFASIASSTNAFATNLSVSIGTFLTRLTIPYSASLSLSTNGDIGVDPTGDQLQFRSNGNTHALSASSSPGFTISSTTKDASGVMYSSNSTSTFLLRNASEPMTLQGFYCKTRTTGQLIARCGDGTNWTASAYCNATGGYTITSSNNTFTAFEDFQCQFGTATGTVPGQVTVTPNFMKTLQ